MLATKFSMARYLGPFPLGAAHEDILRVEVGSGYWPPAIPKHETRGVFRSRDLRLAKRRRRILEIKKRQT